VCYNQNCEVVSLNLAHHVHCNFGHFGIDKNFLTLSQGLYRDVSDLCHSCDVCLQANAIIASKLQSYIRHQYPQDQAKCGLRFQTTS